MILSHAEQIGGSGDDFLPVGDEQGGAVLHDWFYGFKDGLFGFGVDRGGGFVEDEYSGFL